MSNRLHVLPLSANDVATGLAAVAAEMLPGAQVSINVHAAVNTINFQTRATASALTQDGSFVQFVNAVSAIPSLPCGSANLKIEGGQPQYALSYHSEETQTYFTIDSSSDAGTGAKLYSCLEKRFKLMSRGAVLGASLPVADQAAIHFREQAVGDLAAQVSRLGEFMTQMAQNAARSTEELTASLQERFQHRQAELEDTMRKNREELELERATFRKEKAAFDDRQRTHVRRDLLKKIQENIMARATANTLSGDARKSRAWIHALSWIFISLSSVAGLFAGRQLYLAAGHMPFDWRVVPPFSVAALLFAATLIFYFRWTSRWADRVAHDDLAVAQYATDILRASWLVELLFEYKDERQKEIAPEMLASLSEGLFKREEFRVAHYHPTDDVTSLVRRIRSLKAGPEGLEITAADGKRR